MADLRDHPAIDWTLFHDPRAYCGCGHIWLLHDIEEHDGDGTDLCCVEGCDQRECPGAKP